MIQMIYGELKGSVRHYDVTCLGGRLSFGPNGPEIVVPNSGAIPCTVVEQTDTAVMVRCEDAWQQVGYVHVVFSGEHAPLPKPPQMVAAPHGWHASEMLEENRLVRDRDCEYYLDSYDHSWFVREVDADFWRRTKLVPKPVLDALRKPRPVWSAAEVEAAKAHGSTSYEQAAKACDEERERETMRWLGPIVGYVTDSDLDGECWERIKRNDAEREAAIEAKRRALTPRRPDEGLGDWAARHKLPTAGDRGVSHELWLTMVAAEAKAVEP